MRPSFSISALRPLAIFVLCVIFGTSRAVAATADTDAAPGLLFYLSGERGTTADVSAAGTAEPTFDQEVSTIRDGAQGAALRCGNFQRLAWTAPGNIYAQRGTLAFFWRAREPVGPTEFPVFRVGYADHSSWDMVWLRIDYNGHGFDAFVTDASLARTRVSMTLSPFPPPDAWIHLAVSWDETRGLRFYVNGRLAAKQETVAVYNAGLDQFGPHSRIISPYQVQSDYNFTRGGDLDELRIYDHMLDDASIAALARHEPLVHPTGAPARTLADSATRAEWFLRYGWNRPQDPPPYLAGDSVCIRKVEIHDAFDLKRWWWKANDGIRETTWPGVYNRSRLPGRNDYFQLPDWDCYSLSGRAITFNLPDEPWNWIEISGAAWGQVTRGPDASAPRLFERPKGQERTVNRLETEQTAGQVTFTNVEPEEPIGEFSVYHVATGREPVGSPTLSFILGEQSSAEPDLQPVIDFVRGRFPVDERQLLVARSAGGSFPAAPIQPVSTPSLPIVHVLIPNTWDGLSGGLDGIGVDLPALRATPLNGDLIPLNLRVADPLWPARSLLDFTFSVKPGEGKKLWLDLRDRLLPHGQPLYLTVASASPDFNATVLTGTSVRLVFKERAAAVAEHELDRFTQARDAYAMLVEEHPNTPKFHLWARFKGDLDDLLRVNPNHRLGREYLAAAVPSAPRPPFVQTDPPAGVPLWAFRQVELLGRVKNFVLWYIDHRQIANGEMGGGLSDDTDLTNVWPGVALMGAEPEKIAASLRAVLDACFANGMMTNGLPTIQADELHSYEEGINCLGQNLVLDSSSPRQLERAMVTTRGIAGLTGVNAAGHRHIRSSYYSGTKLATEGPWGWSKHYSYLVLHPVYLIADYTGNPAARSLVLELADGLLAHFAPGKGVAGLPAAIQFTTDAEGAAARTFPPWPLFWASWRWTGDNKYLAPLFAGGLSVLSAINANALDQLDLRQDWNRRLQAGEPTRPIERKRSDRRTPSAQAVFRTSTSGHFAWQLSGDKSILARLYEQQIEQCARLDYINTQGSLWIDRVGVPYADLQRARLGGVALTRNALFPGHLVSWTFAAPANEQSVALLLRDGTRSAFTVIACNLSAAPVRATMTGCDVLPGEWEITQGTDTNDDDRIDADQRPLRTAVFERTRTLEFTLPPRATSILSLKLKRPGVPYWQRPDLGIERGDIKRTAQGITVTVHSLGSVPAPAARLLLRDHSGRVVAEARVPALAAPIDLWPKTADVPLAFPATAALDGAVLELQLPPAVPEITTRNNQVRL